MSLTFRRAWRVQVDTLDVSALDIEFRTVRTIKPIPNRCVTTVWNMNEDHRAQVLKRVQPNAGSKGVSVQIEAGYIDGMSVLFSGDLREAAGQRDPTNRKIVMSGEDGGRAYREARINRQFAAGTSVADILRAIASALGVGLGNLAPFLPTISVPGWGASIPGPYTPSSSASTELTGLLRSAGFTWSIQRGVLQVQQVGKPLTQKQILLSPTTGLIGSPQASIDATVSLGSPQQFNAQNIGKNPRAKRPHDSGILRLQCLLIPGIDPGRVVTLDSAEFKGDYMLTEVESVGQTWGNDWHHVCVARKVT